MKKKIALITGITGQDGAYLANLLLNKGYKIYGTYRRTSSLNLWRLEELGILESIELLPLELLEKSNIERIVKLIKPDEIYNLAAQSFVSLSFENPIYTAQADALGVLRILESIRLINKRIKFYQASSSEMFGNNIDKDGFQRETTPMNPVSPYGCAKVYAYNICRNYRNAYDMFISNGILFNHESPRRGTNFVTNKVAKEAVKIKLGLSNELKLGNLDASRDWGHAEDYVRAMWLILQHDKPNDFVCSTGISHTVKDLVKYVFNKLDLDWKKYVAIDKRYYRSEELEHLKGDCSKIKNDLGWMPLYTFETMLDEMIEYWLKNKNNL